MGGRPSPGSGAQRRRMQRGQDIHHVKSLKETRGESMLEEEAPCVTGCQWTTDGFIRIFTSGSFYLLFFLVM